VVSTDYPHSDGAFPEEASVESTTAAERVATAKELYSHSIVFAFN
jgi:hypothetical protein